MAIDGFEWDAPNTPGNAGKDPGEADRPAFPKVRVVTVLGLPGLASMGPRARRCSARRAC